MTRKRKNKKRDKRRKQRKQRNSGVAQQRQQQAARKSPDPAELTPGQMTDDTGCWPDKVLVEVGVVLHEGRKVRPVSPDDAPEGATYDELVGITFKALDVTSCGFQIKAQPRRIGVTEVSKCAQASCKVCHGVGKWPVTETQCIGRDGSGRKIMQPFQFEQSCGCAEKVYKAEHKNFLIDSRDGEWIALDGLEIERVKEDGDEVSEVPDQVPDDQRDGTQSMPELSDTSS